MKAKYLGHLQAQLLRSKRHSHLPSSVSNPGHQAQVYRKHSNVQRGSSSPISRIGWMLRGSSSWWPSTLCLLYLAVKGHALALSINNGSSSGRACTCSSSTNMSRLLAKTLLHNQVHPVLHWPDCVLTEGPSSAGLYTDQEGLLAFKQAIPDFDLNQRRGEFPGWSDAHNDNYCRWFGVTCDNGNVVGLQLPQNASWYSGEQSWQACEP